MKLARDRNEGSEVGVERPARQALTPRTVAYAQVVLLVDWLLLQNAFCAAQDRMDETVVSVDADMEAATIAVLDASVVVQSMLLAEEQADAMETTVSSCLEHGWSFVLL